MKISGGQMNKQTPEQEMASNPAASVWVAASAGTGKTFVLTNRVLRILLSGTSADRILCLTFTKAAAAEMANRINDRLGRWVNADQASLQAELADLTGKMPGAEELDHARKLFAHVLEVPGGMKIQTIHAFCQSLLGRFPLEARITPHFQVMDERTTLDHLKKAQDAVLGEARPEINDDLARALAHISAKETEQTFFELIGELVGQRSGLERMMRRFHHLGRAIFAMRKILDLSAGDTMADRVTAACSEENFNASGLRLALTALLEGSKGDVERGEKMARWLGSPDLRENSMAEYKSVFLTKEGIIRKTLMTKKVGEACPLGESAMQDEAQRLQLLDEHLRRITLLENSEALLKLGFAMLDVFGESKKRHAVLDYDDLILKVTGLLGQDNVADWILYKLDGGLDHILIDEAQDTNPEQWQVIKILAGEFFSGLGAGDQSRTIFAVGDVKQSIYSFQRADPREFVENRSLFKQKATQVEQAFHPLDLSKSYRSTEAVLALVDATFQAEDRRHALTFSLQEIRHQAFREGQAGLVELWPVEEADEILSEEDWAPPVLQKPSATAEMKLARRLADQIGDWLEHSEPLKAKGRPITPGDVMILVRRRTIFVDHMIRALKARNIPVSGQDKMRLSEQIAVMDLMAIGNFVLLPDDDLTLAVVLKSPLIGFDEDQLYDLAAGRETSLWASLLSRAGESEAYKAACEMLKELTNFADNAPPFEFYNHLLARLKGRERLMARLGLEAGEPIDEFLQLAMDFELNNISSLQAFLDWVNKGDVEVKRDMEQEQNMVRIMTVHAAKGLQAPVVILPDSCQVPKKGGRLLWAGADEAEGDRQEILFWPGTKENEIGPCEAAREKIKQERDQEYLRLLYVALTRAEDRLYITGWQGKKGLDKDSWYEMLRQALEHMAGVEKIPLETGGEILRYSCVQTKKISAPEIKNHKAESLEDLPAWALNHPPMEPVPSRPLVPSRPQEEDTALLSPLLAMQRQRKDKSRYHRGRLIHRLLEIIPNLETGKRAAALYDYLHQPAFDLEEKDIKIIGEQVLDILTNKEFERVFAPGSRAEVPIVGMVGTTPISGQVDRLSISEDEILIIDYKTNRPPPDDINNVSLLYRRQMAAYRTVLRDIYPHRSVRCLLLWTDVPKLMELPDSLLDQILF